MNRKQGIIIVVLLALIATAGVLASRLNSPLLNGVTYSPDDQPSFNAEDSNLKTEYFAAEKTERTKTYTETMQMLKSVIEDESISEETRKDAENKYVDITMNNNYESKVELALKAKGYEDVVCIISNDKVNIIIKSDDILSEKEAREIKNEVVRITSLVDIAIERRN